MSVTTVYAAEVLNVIAERRDLEIFTGTPIFIHSGVDEELVGWLGCPLPTSGYPCEHMGMGDEGSTACWSATEINRLRDENAKLRELVRDMWHDIPKSESCGWDMSTNTCTGSDECIGECSYWYRMHELGIEVSE